MSSVLFVSGGELPGPAGAGRGGHGAREVWPAAAEGAGRGLPHGPAAGLGVPEGADGRGDRLLAHEPQRLGFCGS